MQTLLIKRHLMHVKRLNISPKMNQIVYLSIHIWCGWHGNLIDGGYSQVDNSFTCNFWSDEQFLMIGYPFF